MISPLDGCWIIQTIIVVCLPVLIIHKILHLDYVQRCMRKYAIFQSSSVPGIEGNSLLFYISILTSNYKQSTPKCSALALFLQYIFAFCLLYGKQGLFRASLLFKPAIVFYKPESVEIVLGDPDLIEKGNEYKLLVPWLGSGLITGGGTKWRKHRKLLTPTFHFSILGKFIAEIEEQSEILISKLLQRTQEPWIDALPLISACTLDVICQTAMGISINVQNDENCAYYHAIHEIGDAFMYRLLRPWLYPDIIFNLTSRGRKFKTTLQILHSLSEKVIKGKKAEMLSNSNSTPKTKEELEESLLKKRKPFLELLLELHLKDPSFTETDVKEEVDNFMLAGHDAPATTISWVLYCLGLYPEIQKKVYEELVDIFDTQENKSISLETLTRMRYLECVIKETMRLYPTVPIILRENKKAFKALGHDVHPGSLICIFIYCLHRDPESFPNPELFDPDRFLPENSKDRHPYAYVPFSAGPRNCIGQKFGMMEMKIILSRILKHFRVISLDSREKVILYPNILTRSVRPVRMRFELR